MSRHISGQWGFGCTISITSSRRWYGTRLSHESNPSSDLPWREASHIGRETKPKKKASHPLHQNPPDDQTLWTASSRKQNSAQGLIYFSVLHSVFTALQTPIMSSKGRLGSLPHFSAECGSVDLFLSKDYVLLFSMGLPLKIVTRCSQG